MKVNIKYTPPAPKPVTPSPKEKYKNPVGVWSVTTDGDCEGRSTRNLGIYKGHVAAIAFFLAGKEMYDLKFESMEGKMCQPTEIPNEINTTKKQVWVQMNIESGTWDMKPDVRAACMAEFLDAKDIIDVVEKTPQGVFYGASCLVLK